MGKCAVGYVEDEGLDAQQLAQHLECDCSTKHISISPDKQSHALIISYIASMEATIIIPNINTHLSWTTILAASLWIFLYFLAIARLSRQNTQMNKYILITMLFFNPLIHHQLVHGSFEVIRVVAVAVSLLLPRRISCLIQNGYLIGVVVCVGGWVTPVVVGAHILKTRHKNIPVKLLIMLLAILVQIGLRFAEHFAINFQLGVNMMPLLYSHMFEKYLLLYQTMMLLSPYLVMLLLLQLNTHYRLKVVIIYFFSLFTTAQLNSNNQAFPLFSIFGVEAWAYLSFSKSPINKELEIWNVLTIGVFLTSTVGYVVYQHFDWLYRSTHAAGVSYLLVGQLVFWIPHAIYITEGIALRQTLKQHQQTHQRKRLFDFLLAKIKQI